jgi:tryptophanyl-tRNA synthetase
MAAAQETADCFFGVSDLHAMTTPHDPAELRSAVAEVSTLLLAAGLDPARATLFRQSQVPAHRELAYLLECTAYTGELNRMIQFKEKGRGVASTRASLYTYPVLMAADILLYRPTSVPVGEDQRQHVELTRDLAIRFNTTYGRVFTVPEVTLPRSGARVMDLQSPTSKMSKSDLAGSGVIRLLDPPDVVRRKVARAVTDSDTGPNAVRSADDKPGVTNLLDILAACGGTADGITTYGALKSAVTEAVVAVLEPLQKSYAELAADPGYVASVYSDGSARCRDVTASVLADATAAMGL